VFLNGCGESQHQKIWSPKHDFPVIFGFFLLQNVENNLNALYRFPDSFMVAITEPVQHRINLKMLFFIFSFSLESSTYFCQYVSDSISFPSSQRKKDHSKEASSIYFSRQLSIERSNVIENSLILF